MSSVSLWRASVICTINSGAERFVTTPVNYDSVAPTFERRYEAFDYRGVTQALLSFVAASTPAPSPLVLEVGCGTGHWLRILANDTPSRTIGLDLSSGMLGVARTSAPEAPLVRSGAEVLPLAPAVFDAVVCINAVHHFRDPRAFIAEARRVLKPGGGLFVAGLDPHAGVDAWWLYDLFPDARQADLQRYPAASALRHWMADAGFGDVRSNVVQRWTGALTGADLVARRMLERTGTSQLMVISDEAYAAGVRLVAEAPDTIRTTDLHVFATVGTAG